MNRRCPTTNVAWLFLLEGVTPKVVGMHHS